MSRSISSLPAPLRYPWTEDKLLAAPPRDVSVLHPKPPRRLVVTYPFSTDVDLQEHVGGLTACHLVLPLARTLLEQPRGLRPCCAALGARAVCPAPDV